MEWNLDREKIKSITNQLAHSRPLQVTFANIIGATRYKTLVRNNIVATRCPKRKEQIDDWNHLTECHKINKPEEGKEKEWLKSVTKFIEAVQMDNPAKPTAL